MAIVADANGKDDLQAKLEAIILESAKNAAARCVAVCVEYIEEERRLEKQGEGVPLPNINMERLSQAWASGFQNFPSRTSRSDVNTSARILGKTCRIGKALEAPAESLRASVKRSSGYVQNPDTILNCFWALREGKRLPTRKKDAVCVSSTVEGPAAPRVSQTLPTRTAPPLAELLTGTKEPTLPLLPCVVGLVATEDGEESPCRSLSLDRPPTSIFSSLTTSAQKRSKRVSTGSTGNLGEEFLRMSPADICGALVETARKHTDMLEHLKETAEPVEAESVHSLESFLSSPTHLIRQPSKTIEGPATLNASSNGSSLPSFHFSDPSAKASAVNEGAQSISPSSTSLHLRDPTPNASRPISPNPTYPNICDPSATVSAVKDGSNPTSPNTTPPLANSELCRSEAFSHCTGGERSVGTGSKDASNSELFRNDKPVTVGTMEAARIYAARNAELGRCLAEITADLQRACIITSSNKSPTRMKSSSPLRGRNEVITQSKISTSYVNNIRSEVQRS